MRHFNAGTQYRAPYVNIEAGQAAREDVAMAMRGITSSLLQAAKRHLKNTSADAVYQSLVERNNWGNALQPMVAHLPSHDDAHPTSPPVDFDDRPD